MLESVCSHIDKTARSARQDDSRQHIERLSKKELDNKKITGRCFFCNEVCGNKKYCNVRHQRLHRGLIDDWFKYIKKYGDFIFKEFMCERCQIIFYGICRIPMYDKFNIRYCCEKCGKKHTQAQKDHLSKLNKGKVVSLEKRKAISKTLMGHPVSQQTRDKIRLKNTGYKHSEETKQKHRNYKPTQESIDKRAAANKGKKRSAEFKAKRALQVFTPEMNLKKSLAARTRLIKNTGLNYQTSSLEKAAIGLFLKYNINFIHQQELLCIELMRYRYYDFYLPEYNLLIEVDGCYWHAKNIPVNKMNEQQTGVAKNDILKNRLAIAKKYRLLRIWEDELDKLENLIKNNFIGLEYMEIQPNLV